MTTVARWTPFRDVLRLQDEMNRLLHEPRAAEREAIANRWSPAVDIYEDQEGITLRAELPGLTAEEIDIRVENNTLTLKGERKLESAEKKDLYRRIERNYGAFSRSFALPITVDVEKVRADSKHGVLTVFLPKREETKPKQIHVKIDT